MHVRKLSLVLILVVNFTVTLGTTLWAGQAQLSWQAPTTNEDGTPATDLTSFRIHYGTLSRGTIIDPRLFNYQQRTTIAASQTTHTVMGLTDGIRYFFSVTALDSSGNESKYSPEVNIVISGTPTVPVASFTANPTSGTAPLTVRFTDTSTPAASLTAWSWAFGDGSTSSAQNPSHSYAAAGFYTVTLGVTGPGGSDTATTTITVTAGGGQSTTLINASFTSGADGFVYVDDAFRNTSRPTYASGTVGSGRLQVTLGGQDNNTITGMSGGWRRAFTVGGSTSAAVTLRFRYNLSQTPHYETDEYSEMLATLGSLQLGTSGQTYVARITGNGNGGSTLTTNWRTFTTTRQLAPGTYTLTLGGYSNKKTYNDETTTVLIDDVVVTMTTGALLAQSSPLTVQTAAVTQPLGTRGQAGQRLGLRTSSFQSAVTDLQQAPRSQREASTSRSTQLGITTVQTPQKLWLEAEAGDLTEPMGIGTDVAEAASQYIWAPEGIGDMLETSPAAGIAQYTVKVTESGFYVIWGRLLSNAKGTGSFFLTVNKDAALVWALTGAEAAGEKLQDISQEDWRWQQAAQDTTPIVFLKAGTNILTIQHRQAGTKLDRLLITNDLEFVPQD
jgi:PKD repeat protein